jgi:hypothetical protein
MIDGCRNERYEYDGKKMMVILAREREEEAEEGASSAHYVYYTLLYSNILCHARRTRRFLLSTLPLHA